MVGIVVVVVVAAIVVLVVVLVMDVLVVVAIEVAGALVSAVSGVEEPASALVHAEVTISSAEIRLTRTERLRTIDRLPTCGASAQSWSPLMSAFYLAVCTDARRVDSLTRMAFDLPVPDLAKLIAAWEEFERGEQSPGKVLAKMKTAGLAQVLAQLAQSGWTPAV